ncbi:MAG: hypothetical protein RL722_434 [Pseudomonadota bacterium]|jgi:putative DNA primase/helicase
MSSPSRDFNDVAVADGLEAVRRMVEEATLPDGGAPAAGDPRPSPARAEAGPAPAVQWPEPMLPGQAQAPEIPPSLLPDWLGDHAAAVAASTQTPAALAVMSCLAVLATVLQRRFEVAPYGDSYTEPLPLWTLGAAVSGSRKSSVIGACLAPLVHWEKLQRDRMRQEIASTNAKRAVAKRRVERLLVDAAKAKDGAEREQLRREIELEEMATPEEARAPRLFTGDTTPERLQALLVDHGERMGLHSDEPGIFLNLAGIYSGGQANIDVFLQAYSGSPIRVDRASRSAHLDRPALSMGLMVQPGILNDVASSRRFRDSGLLARFLYVIPVSNVGQRDVRARVSIPPEVREEYERRMLALLEGEPAPVKAPRVLPLSEAAREVWLDLAEEIERQQGAGGALESISDWTSKLPGTVARIACLFELAEVGLQAEEVSQVSIERAVALARLLIVHAQAAFAMLGTDGADADAAQVLKWVQAHGLAEFSRREAQKAMEGRFRNVDRLAKALQRLEAMEVVREFKRINKGTGPSVAYRVNPRCLST